MKIRGLSLLLLLSVTCGADSARAAHSSDFRKTTSEPVIQLAWRDALLEGRKQQALKHLDIAESCFKQALKEAKRTGATPLDLVTCYRSLAEVQVQEDVVEDAYPNYKRALNILKKDEKENFALLAETYGNLGDIAYTDGDFTRAKKLFTEALKVLSDAEQQGTYLYASLEHRYGRTMYKLSDFHSASDSYYDVVSRLMRQPDLPNHNLLIDVTADYIDLFRNTQDQGLVRQSNVQKELLKDSPDMISNGKGVAPSAFSTEIAARLADKVTAVSAQPGAANSLVSNSGGRDAAARVASDSSSALPLTSASSIDTARRVSPASTSPTSSGIFLPNSGITPDQKLHDIALDQQVEQQRVDFYERMVSIDIKALGPNHPSVARDLTSLATVYLASNNYLEAKPLLQRALVIYEQTYGANASLTERTRTLVHVISEEERARDSGAPPANEYVSRLATIPIAAQTPEVALRLNYLALQCFSYGKLNEAYTLYSWALAATARVSGDRGMLTACCLNDYARVLRACNQESVAAQYESDAAGIVRTNIMKKAANKT